MTIKDINPAGYYTINQTAEVLGVCRRTIYNKIKQGRLKVSLQIHLGEYKQRIKGLRIIEYNHKTFLD